MMLTPAASLVGHQVVRSLGSCMATRFARATSGRTSIDRMVTQAAQRDANAVINVRFGTSYIMGNASEILAYGEAVVVEKT